MARRVVSFDPKLWLRHPEVYPVVGAVSAGLCFLVWSSYRHVTMSPDTHWVRASEPDFLQCVGVGVRGHAPPEGARACGGGGGVFVCVFGRGGC